MSSNGPSSPKDIPSSPSGTHLADLRLSLDSDRGISPPVSANGILNGRIASPNPNGNPHKDDADTDPVVKLQRELEKTRQEKDELATHYRNLLAKLTTMRTTLGNKLKQDAVRAFILTC